MTRLDPQPWMSAPQTVKVMSALGDARFVGGVVRNALLGRPISDIDIATPLQPDQVKARLDAARIKVVPTGIEHGTITAVVDGTPFEVTTLRRDVSTDGRHAVVAYTSSWAEDALRRDFTINALYADLDGTITDTVGGVADINAGRVRFVGDPGTRIQEDYLRILRFFRFHAWYGRTAIDAEALYACEKEMGGLARLSGERIAKEMFKLLEAPNPVAVLMSMGVVGILDLIVPGASDILPLRRLASIQAELGAAPDGVLRLAALLPEGRTVLTAQLIAARWKLSKAVRDRLIAAAGAPRDIAFYDPRHARRLLYRMGQERFRDALLLALVTQTRDDWQSILKSLEHLVVPRFPISGKDVVARGIRMGPLVGHVLHTVETWWVENDFPEDAAVVRRLDEMVKQVHE